MNLKKRLEAFLPPIVSEFLRNLIYSRYGWHGNYSSWKKAKKLTTGYDNYEIMEKVRDALL
jgi:hypothetical protein